MPLHFDHAVIAVRDLDTAIRDYRDLGFTVTPGGLHANRATKNALITFRDATYLELLTKTDELVISGKIDFSPLVDRGEGLHGFSLRSEGLEADATRLRNAGLAVGENVPGERRRAEGTLVQWKVALLDGGFVPFLIQDVTPLERRISNDPTVTTHANGVTGIRGVELLVKNMATSWGYYTRLFGMSPEADSKSYRSIASVNLQEAPERSYTGGLHARGEALSAVNLVCDHGGDEQFTLERTHNVRYQLVKSTS
jgi:catechol 2,3-dioxygenase-like lactoylglutathione lyase family enzyme